MCGAEAGKQAPDAAGGMRSRGGQILAALVHIGSAWRAWGAVRTIVVPPTDELTGFTT